jgi:two-component system, OmpR family, sensor kinase
VRALPIRVRVTLVFTAVMAAVLAITGFVVYDRTRSDLDDGINRDLQKRAAALATAIRVTDVGLGEPARSLLRDRQLGFSQVLTSSGRLFDRSHQYGRPVLDPQQAEATAAGAVFVDSSNLPGLGADPGRLLATRIRFEHHALIMVVSASLADRDHALETLRELLLIGGPIALVLAAIAAYFTVAAALRPVEEMRARAAAISSTSSERLPVPAAADELRRLGLTLNEMLERINAAVERERGFVDDASHELRTPLTAQRTELELALRYAESEEELRDAIASSIAEVDRLSALADDLLLVARADKGALTVDRRPVEVSRVLGAVAAREAARAGAAGRSLRVEGDDGLVASADSARLEQAIGNLVENALIHGAGEIVMSGEARNGSVEVHVRDGGGGFAPDFLPHAFERFRRADDSRAGEGTGLGLAIVEAIAVAHGGSAHARNDADGGADVWIELPAGE